MNVDVEGPPSQQPAFPGFQYTPGHGTSRLKVYPNGTQDYEVWHPGMSVRTWLAGQALAAGHLPDGAVQIADLTLKELSK